MVRWPRRVLGPNGVATDGTGLVTVPDKARGHLSSAFNALCPVMTGDKLVLCTYLCTSCVPLWRPLLTIKGGLRHTGGRFGSLELGDTVASSRTQEHWNIHQRRTRVLRVSAARTWVNDPCADRQTRSLHNPAPANRRRDPSEPIGVVSHQHLWHAR